MVEIFNQKNSCSQFKANLNFFCHLFNFSKLYLHFWIFGFMLKTNPIPGILIILMIPNIQDLVRGRTFAGPSLTVLPDIWSDLFRVMDDIKESVRLAAGKAVNGLSRTCIR